MDRPSAVAIITFVYICASIVTTLSIFAVLIYNNYWLLPTVASLLVSPVFGIAWYLWPSTAAFRRVVVEILEQSEQSARLQDPSVTCTGVFHTIRSAIAAPFSIVATVRTVRDFLLSADSIKSDVVASIASASHQQEKPNGKLPDQRAKPPYGGKSRRHLRR